MNTVNGIFWITNPDNTYRGNVSAGSEATGFWLAFPEHPTGKFEGTEIAAKTWPRRMQIREFSGNVAALYLFGLTCPVQRIVFEVVDDWSFPLLAPAIGETRPQYLELWPSCEHLSGYRGSYLTDALKSPGAASLEQLDLRICIQNHDLDKEVYTVLVRAGPSLSLVSHSDGFA